MCNRFAVAEPLQVKLWTNELLEWEWLELQALLNAAPSEEIPVVVRDDDGKPRGRMMRWGVRLEGSPRLYMNAQREKAFSSNLWKGPVQKRRCAVVADGFFEWPPDPAPKTPYFFRRKGGRPFSFAGIWFRGSIEKEDTFAILTTEPNAQTAAIGHPRSPVLLDERNVRDWFAPGPLSPDQLNALTNPYPGEELERYRVTKRMNASRYKEADTIRPLTAEEIAAEEGKTRIKSVERADGEQLSLL